MNRFEYARLLSDRGAVERMLRNTPEDEVIEIHGLKAQLETITSALDDFKLDARQPARARVTFRGKPVVGSYGIFAEFGMTATKAFTDAVMMLAASIEVPLKATGPIPNRAQNHLLITSTALGSFGFELEEYRETPLLIEDESPLSDALSQTQVLLERAALGSDDELTEIAAGKEPRVVVAFRAFLKTLIDNEAVCSVSVDEKLFAFSDVGEVRKSWERLDQKNLHEDPIEITGAFQGALPNRRTFELKNVETGEIISGKIGPLVGDPGAINNHLYEERRIRLMATRVGDGHPKYVLAELPWHEDATVEVEEEQEARLENRIEEQ